jgi:hypothetical protein
MMMLKADIILCIIDIFLKARAWTYARKFRPSWKISKKWLRVGLYVVISNALCVRNFVLTCHVVAKISSCMKILFFTITNDLSIERTLYSRRPLKGTGVSIYLSDLSIISFEKVSIFKAFEHSWHACEWWVCILLHKYNYFGFLWAILEHLKQSIHCNASKSPFFPLSWLMKTMEYHWIFY